MKKSSKIFGAITSLVLVIGFVFRSNHWHGGTLTLAAGTLLAIVFLFIFGHYLRKNGLLPTWIIILGIIALLLILMGVFFKLFHWPGGTANLCFGAIVYIIPVIGYIIHTARKK